MKLQPLTPEEEHIIVHKWTEAPFSGALLDEKRTGVFVCRRCQTPLYRSWDKFDSWCGWPSFDDAIPGKVKRTTDADGRRTEITCATCGAHLGHVFVWEHMTEKNTRHCVNSLSMQFIPEQQEESNHQIATLGGGCFWCTESAFLQLKWVHEVRSWYMWGKRPNPTYEQVCTWVSGHIEVVQVFFDPNIISYQQILEVFFTIHDPTTLNRQWNDVGEQYASAIFYHNEEQHKIAQEIIRDLEDRRIRAPHPIVTQVRPVETFWIAEDYHQNFYDNNPNKPYCQIIINPKLEKLRKNYKNLLK